MFLVFFLACTSTTPDAILEETEPVLEETKPVLEEPSEVLVQKASPTFRISHLRGIVASGDELDLGPDGPWTSSCTKATGLFLRGELTIIEVSRARAKITLTGTAGPSCAPIEPRKVILKVPGDATNYGKGSTYLADLGSLESWPCELTLSATHPDYSVSETFSLVCPQ